jgi:hypothetical protein
MIRMVNSLDEFLCESVDDHHNRMQQLQDEEEAALSSDKYVPHGDAHADEYNKDDCYANDEDETSNNNSTSTNGVTKTAAPLPDHVTGGAASATMERSISNDQIMMKEADSKDVSSNVTRLSSPASRVAVTAADLRAVAAMAPLRLQRMEHLLRHCQPGSLVAFDLDDTIHQSKYHPSWLMTTPGMLVLLLAAVMLLS